jgi:hypothetical protein
VWWKCSRGHEWQAILRNKGISCSYCSGNLLSDLNRLSTVKPELVSEWNYDKNGTLKPEDVTVSSNRKVWWKCSRGHEWQAIVGNRKCKGKGCPYCSGNLPSDSNRLSTVKPELVSEWNYDKNGTLKPEDVTVSSNRKVWWKCSRGHEWETAIATRSRCGCPYCSGYLPSDSNRLSTVKPELVSEWNYDKNGTLKPEDVSICSDRKAWWKCFKGHVWQAAIKSRSKSGCPYCAKYGYSPSKPGTFYINLLGNWIKFGITNRHPKERRREQKVKSGFPCVTIKTLSFQDGAIPLRIEGDVKKYFAQHTNAAGNEGFIFDGSTETLPKDMLDDLCDFVSSLLSHRNAA